MSSGNSPEEQSLDFSNSSSFSSASHFSDGNASIVRHLQPLVNTDGVTSAAPLSPPPAPACLPLPPRRPAPTSAPSAAQAGTRATSSTSPLLVLTPIEALRTFTRSEDGAEPLLSSAPADTQRCFFSANRDSASPPRVSSYFGVAVVEVALAAVGREAEQLQEPQVGSEEEAFEEIGTPCSRVSAALARASSSGLAGHDSPSVARLRESRRHSLPTEAVAVNASQAREAHDRLHAFTTATMRQYQRVKLKVAQRIYRIYYDKWRWRATQPREAATPQRCTRHTQTPSVARRSVSAEAEFADIDSFHPSRSVSATSTPQRRAAAAAGDARTPHQQRLSLSDFEEIPSPSPRRGDTTASQQQQQQQWRPAASPPIVFSPSPIRADGAGSSGALPSLSPSLARLQTAAAQGSTQEALAAREWHPSIAPPAAEGIGVRTKPAKLVDYGRHSDAPRRKSAHVANPVVKVPRVVPSPERIFRL